MSWFPQRPTTSKWFVVVLSLAVVISSCTETPNPARESIPRGGTLAVNFVPSPVAFTLDPQTAYSSETWEFLRCCLVRTLLSYTGQPTGQGGAELRPDLATSIPDVSADGLTWTFRLEKGLRYGPPLTETEILSPDIVRALERTARMGEYRLYYSVIEGFSQVTAGEAESISGLETPDDHTLVIHLTVPTGDLGYRLSLPATAPIPPSADGASLGVADGHEDYGPFLVSSGPYAIEGAESLDFNASPDQRKPSSGFDPDSSFTLVRNPSWRLATDRLRPAYVDRIEVSVVDDKELAAEQVQSGTADVLLHSAPTQQVPADVLENYRKDPALADHVVFGSADTIIYLTMNLAVPPFDDVHVRKAVNLALDKSSVIDIHGGPAVNSMATHMILDSMENNFLLNYDPYATPGRAGDPSRAKQEMAQSRHDRDGDGVCDVRACRELHALTAEFPGVDAVGLADSIRSDLHEIGIGLDVRILPSIDDYFARLNDPRRHVPLGIAAGWAKDFPGAGSFVTPLFAREGLAGCCNYSLVGATPEELQTWGYQVTSVPSVEEKVNECRVLLGDDQIRCWTELDQQLMEQVVPWVPLFLPNSVYIVSPRVAATSFDQFTALPALDRIALSEPT
jgi:peptide/nickel transport system substrate-binding protein